MVEKLHWQLRVLPHVVELFADETLSSPFRLLCSKRNLPHYVCRVLVSVVASYASEIHPHHVLGPTPTSFIPIPLKPGDFHTSSSGGDKQIFAP